MTESLIAATSMAPAACTDNKLVPNTENASYVANPVSASAMILIEPDSPIRNGAIARVTVTANAIFTLFCNGQA